MASVQGHCDQAFSKVKDLLAENVASEEELGASICININGKNIVDIWAGYVDENRSKEWEENTIANVWSSSKTVSNLAVLMLHDRGLLDVHDKISKHWPEFAENGKEDTEVRHILSHSAGVSGWQEPVTMLQALDMEYSIPLLAKQAPWWKAGTASGYHAMTQGHLDYEVVRRITGKTMKQFIAEEISAPLQADYQLGALEKDFSRISTLLPPPSITAQVGALDPDSIPYKTFTRPPSDALFALTKEWRAADVPAANGHGNARSLNRILSAVTLGGEVDGVRLLSPKTMDLIFQEQTNGTDLCIGHPIKYGIGFGLPLPETITHIPEGRKCFWGGWGGSIMIMDLDNKMTFTYVMNKMGGGTLGTERTYSYVNAAYAALDAMGKAEKGNL